MKIPQSTNSLIRKSLYSALVFFGTIMVLSVGYATWNSTMGKVTTGNPLSASGWNALVDNIGDLDSRWSRNGAAIVFTGGNVGIGTTTPGQKLEIHGTDEIGSAIALRNDTVGSTYSFSVDNSATFNLANGVGGTKRLIILNGGNIGIGTTTPFTSLHIARDVSDTEVTGGYGQLILWGITTPTKRLIAWYNTTNNYGFLQWNTFGATWDNVILEPRWGNVGIGTATPGQKLSVAGTIESTSGGFKFPDGTIQTTASTWGENYTVDCSLSGSYPFCIRMNTITGASSCMYTSNAYNSSWAACAYSPF